MLSDLFLGMLPVSSAWLLVLARTLGIAATAPGWGMAAVGWRLRLGLALLLTAVVGPTIEPGLERTLTLPRIEVGAFDRVEDWAALAPLLVVEASIGAALGLGAALIIAAAQQAGEVIGLQAGLAPASLLAPEEADSSGGGSTPLGHLYGLVALAVFLAVDGPLRLVEVLVASYQTLPAGLVPGRGQGVQAPTAEMAAAAFGAVGGALALAVRVAAPVATALILAGLALGWLVRAAPALAPTLSGLVWPARSAIGLVLSWIGLVGLVAVMAASW